MTGTDCQSCSQFLFSYLEGSLLGRVVDYLDFLETASGLVVEFGRSEFHIDSAHQRGSLGARADRPRQTDWSTANFEILDKDQLFEYSILPPNIQFVLQRFGLVPAAGFRRLALFGAAAPKNHNEIQFSVIIGDFELISPSEVCANLWQKQYKTLYWSLLQSRNCFYKSLYTFITSNLAVLMNPPAILPLSDLFLRSFAGSLDFSDLLRDLADFFDLAERRADAELGACLESPLLILFALLGRIWKLCSFCMSITVFFEFVSR